MKAWVITKDHGYDCGLIVEGVASSPEKAREMVAAALCGRTDCEHRWCYEIDEYEMDAIG